MNEKRDRTLFVGAAVLLVIDFIWALMPVNEMPSATLKGLSIALELGMFVGLVGMAPRILRSVPEGGSRGGWIFLLVVGVIAGIGIFVIHLSGGPRVELAPRTSTTSTTANGLPHQMHEELASLNKVGLKIASARWFQTFATFDAAKVQTLTRQDLEEGRTLCRQMRESTDRVLKLFADATAKGIAHSTLSTEPGATRLETWQATREVYSSSEAYLNLIEQHWDEWHANPFPTTSDAKPWQLEIQRLVDATRTASQRAHALLNGETPPPVATGDAATLSKQLEQFIDRLGKLNERLAAARWIKLKDNPTTAATRTRQDLQEARELYSQYHECSQGAVKTITEAQSKNIDLTAFQEEKELAQIQFWSPMEQVYQAALEQLALIDQHWDEWKRQPEAADEKSMKPWQREMKRLDAVMAANLKEVQAATAADTKAPAPPPSTRAPSPPGNNFDQLALQTHMLPAVADYTTALKALQATRWVKSPDANAYHPQKITRNDLHDANEKLRTLIAAIDKLRTALDAEKLPVPAAEKEYWRVKRETSVAFQRLTGLLEENWKEWHVTGIQPKTGEAKAWQKEALRLQGEIDKLKETKQTSILL